MRLILSKKEDLAQIYKQMQENFCLDEIRDVSQAESVYANEKYRIYHLCENEEKVGFIAIWEFEDFAFIEHFVTYANYRNKGLGAKALEVVKQQYSQVILEVEPPEEEMSIRRFAFYQRQGFVPNDYFYMQPSYREKGNEVRLILMSYPCCLSDIKEKVKTIYREVYGKEYQEG